MFQATCRNTHVFIWLDIDSGKLSPTVAQIIAEPDNTLLLSVVSVWEIQIKQQLGKLELEQSLADMVASQQDTNRITIVPVELPHVLALQNLPFHHKDPLTVC